MTTPLKVLALYATFAPDINEMAMVWKSLTDAGRVQARVLAGGSDPLKNTSSTLAHETLPNLEIRRVPGTLFTGSGSLSEDDIEWAAAFKPDVIFCNLHVNMVYARRIAARCGAPIRLHVEHWRHIVLPRRQYLGVPALRPVVSAWLRRSHRRGARAIAISDPTDRLSDRAEPREAYLPHPHPRSAALRVLPRLERTLDEVVFVGSISAWKGAERLGDYFERLLRAEPSLRVRIVGPLGDDTARAAVDRLAPWVDAGRASHAAHLPRQEALALIGGALAVFNPNATGWGLIGDAWAAGTPVLAGERHYDIVAGRNAWVISTGEEFVDAVRMLRDDAATWQRYADAGLALAREEHSIDVVAERLWAFLHDQPLPTSAARRP